MYHQMFSRGSVLGTLIFSTLLLQGQMINNNIFHNIEARNIGPAGMSGRVTAINVVEDNTDIIYIGTAAGGIWKSHNGGDTWEPIFDHEKTSSIGDIAIYQANPNIIYAGTGEGNPRNSHNSGVGMYKSLDGGRSWSHIGLENTRQLHRVIVHPANPDIVWAGSSGSTWAPNPERGVYKSEDGGSTWKQVLYVDALTGVADMRMDPSNPHKIIVAMWEHRRFPWFFNSGGPGSAIYVTTDGGDKWEKIGCEQGLPCGELGRIGLAFAPSQPDYVYAFVESKKNAIYLSTDGGFTWEKRSQSSDNIGSRPFYYADLYVDVKNENRVYSIATEVTVSEDGGKTWNVFAAGNRIHTDHHAWWAHPDNPDHLINGNDGGLFFTNDRGKTWLFVDNLPLAQFYHVRVDNEVPYNVYGGLQDNGSWCGPSQSWFKGGIRNMYWQRLSVGDGFDVVPDPLDHNYGYAMGQAGNLVRYHKPSGQLLPIKPVHPDEEYLRFNWNAGIAVDPHDHKTIYYGSQYLHKSSDHGMSWEIISPDLTTDDPDKQHFLETGGLTYDVTGAEFHCSIISIAPSPMEQGVIWVGTDDGNVQLTRDGGESWSLLSIAGPSPATWVPHIHASTHQAGEAWVVFDDHRRNDWEAHVYHTTDYGQSWSRVVDNADVEGFVYTFIQDNVEADLWFCGTDVGLYYSIDAGQNWNRWTHGYPTTPTRDLAIHPRDGDLIIGTFGRSFWILDDINPLRALAASQGEMTDAVHVFSPPKAVLAAIGESHGYRDGKVGEVLYNGENRPYGALITYSVKGIEGEQDTVEITITHGSEVIRTFQEVVDENGIYRTTWNLGRNAPRMPQTPAHDNWRPRAGVKVIPRSYEVSISMNGESSSATLEVLADPRLDVSNEEFAAKNDMVNEFYSLVEEVTSVADNLRNAEETMRLIESRAKIQNIQLEKETVSACQQKLKEIKLSMYGKEVQGIYRDPSSVTSILFSGMRMLDILSPVSANQQAQMQMCKTATEVLKEQWDSFKSNELAMYKSAVADAGISLF